jgi:hypothetical protein
LETSTQNSVIDGGVTRPPAPLLTAAWLAARLQATSRVAGLFAVAVGILVLLVWWLKVGRLGSIGLSLVTMKPNAALGFILGGVALWSSKKAANDGARRVAVACAAAVTLLGVFTLLQYVTGWNLGIDRLLVFDDGPSSLTTRWPGRMAIVTALNFTLFGLALLFLDRRLGGFRPTPALASSRSTSIASSSRSSPPSPSAAARAWASRSAMASCPSSAGR